MTAPERNTFDAAAWQNPPVEFRPAPLWIWNDRLDPEELRRQVRLFAEHGYGGFFMHARIGLRVPYLGEEWFACVRMATEEAARVGIKAWIYDEERWPSGFAGGAIAASGLDYAGHALACREVEGRRVFEVVRSQPAAWLNGACDPDLLNPAVTEAFLRLTHDRYQQHIGQHFGTTTPGSFADEPSYVQWSRADKFETVPWTPDLERRFEKEHGYALMPLLGDLFYDEGDYRRVRLDFYRTVTRLFIEGFLRPIYDWCAQHGLASVGHLMMEDGLAPQVRAVGATMPGYEYFHVPGIDYLGDGLAWPVLQKQCDSVAHQLGRDRLLGEAFGGAGWETALPRLKPAADLLLALGTNLVNQHMALYSVRGYRKRDYPPSAFYQLPGFPLYRSFNDYLGRLSYVLTRGRPVRRIAVLHPIQSAWALFTPRNTQPVDELDARFNELSRQLLAIQRDYDYADELLMETHARVAADRLLIGQASYEAVVVPAAVTWNQHTFDLLRLFVQQGGTVVAIEPVATDVDGKPSDELAAFFAQTAVRRLPAPTTARLERALARVPRDLRVTDERGRVVRTLVAMHRTTDEREIFFLTFSTQARAFTARIELTGTGRVELLDATTGHTRPLPALTDGGRTVVTLEIPAHGSRLLVLDKRPPVAGETRLIETVREPAGAEPLRLAGPWSVTRIDPNVFVFERAELKLEQSPWTAPMGLMGFGGPGNFATASVPNVADTLAQCIAKGVQPANVKAWVRFRFRLPDPRAMATGVALVLDDAEAFSEIVVNGQPITATGTDWWLDPSFRRIDLGTAVRPGPNQIECRVRSTELFEPGTLRALQDSAQPENCYLLGDFHVAWRGGHRVAIEPARALLVEPGADLTRAGLPFYAGRVRYETAWTLPEVAPGRRYVLRFAPIHGEGVRLRVNDRLVQDLWGPPFEADVTEFLRCGENRLEVVLYSTAGNVLGHLHHRVPWLDPGHAQARYLFQPLGLGGVPELRVTR